MKTILLKFAGPLQSWGTDSHFETRHTDFYPSKSAVIGVISASLGYRRSEDEKIQKLNELSFAIRIDQPGKLMRDYHIARKYKSDGKFDRSYVTNRYYLEDAVFVVGLFHEDDNYMDEIEEGLRNPYFQTFMGRRSLPMCADFIMQVTTEELLETLQNYQWQASDWYKKKYADEISEFEIYVDSDLSEKKSYNLRKDKVVSFSQKERKFAYRYESRIVTKLENCVQNTQQQSEHDFWNSIGE